MVSFFKRLWPYVRPYRGRLFLGMLCGVFCGLSNGVLLLVIKTVVNLVFGKSVSAADELNNLPLIFRPLAQKLAESLPTLKTPSSTTALVLERSPDDG